eukprot:TRINITY_DN5296_c0_g1_i3.p1 TRINITY_DN5296_c0_g1~~TRINITY_DN5296_c0_g1_i3.p1  ORF type:complete len:419 (-),score=98.24 TRINITY_DN5296_c0_g1_i3:6-1262(-)
MSVWDGCKKGLSKDEKSREWHRVYRLENRPALREKGRLYRLRHREAINAKRKAYRKSHKETLKEQNKRYRQENKQTIQEINKNYRNTHKEAIKTLLQHYYHKNKIAIKEKNKQYYLRNRENIMERMREYGEKHRGAKRARGREYYECNRERIKARQRDYYVHNVLVVRERSKEYRVRNKAVVDEKNRLYRLRHRKPRRVLPWATPEHVMRFFAHTLSELRVSAPEEWYRVSRDQISRLGGGNLWYPFRNLSNALQLVYPEEDWNHNKIQGRAKKSSQRWLRIVLGEILPKDTEIVEDYSHPDLLWDQTNNHKMELDIWVPKYLLALEYQGEQHYFDLYGNGSLQSCQLRDLQKKETCQQRGITLLTIPYWWDRKKESLIASLHSLRPDIPLPLPPSLPPPSTIPTHHKTSQSFLNTEL